MTSIFKFKSLALLLCLALPWLAAAQNNTPINRGLLQSDLNANGKAITNAASLSTSNLVVTGQATFGENLILSDLAGGGDFVPYISDSGTIQSTSITPTEAAHLAGVTAPIQSQLNGKLNAANNLSDVQSAATARNNMGLGTAATQSTNAFLFPVIDRPTKLIFGIDSLTSGTAGIGTLSNPGMTFAYALSNYFRSNPYIVFITNSGVAGQLVETANANFNSEILPLISTGATNTIVFCVGGANDMASHGVPARLITNLAGYYGKVKGAGATLVGYTMTDNATFQSAVNVSGEIKRDIVNAYIRTNAILDYLVDAAAMFPQLTNNGVDCTVDGGHLSTNSHAAIARETLNQLQKLPNSYGPITLSADPSFGVVDIYYGRAYAGGTSRVSRGKKTALKMAGDTPAIAIEDNNTSGAILILQESGRFRVYSRTAAGNFAATDVAFDATTNSAFANGYQINKTTSGPIGSELGVLGARMWNSNGFVYIATSTDGSTVVNKLIAP